MNLIVRDPMVATPSKRELMERALEPHLLLGMPHLTPAGLSETWLMKELAHRHWLMLARRMGMDDADFRSADGRGIYAAISATSVRVPRFELARANDVLTIMSRLDPVSRTQVSTRHRLLIGETAIGEIELVSAFVRRERDGDNHSIARATLSIRPPSTFVDCALARDAAAIRAARSDAHRETGAAIETFTLSPDPVDDFNGVGLLYFAYFQGFFRRALQQWFVDGRYRDALRSNIYFLGNIRPGESLRVELMACDVERRPLSCCIRREDGAVIARVVLEYAG